MNFTSFDLNAAVALAAEAHQGQTDKAGQPYILHPLRVMLALGPDADEHTRMVAVLHDVIEDTDVTATGLSILGAPEAVVDAVMAITHPPGERNVVYWERVKVNPIARRVKLADIADNLSRLDGLDEATQTRLRSKYERAVATLAYGMGES